MSRKSREIEDRFIEAWSDIAGLWGVNRSVGRIHALLFLVEDPLDAEGIRERLQISHGNVSTSLKDLIAWGVIRKFHRPGERRTRYEAELDPWTWFHTCIRERRRREVVPVLEKLRVIDDDATAAAAQTRGAAESERLALLQKRVHAFSKFSEEFVDLIDTFLAIGSGPLGGAMRKIARSIPKKRR